MKDPEQSVWFVVPLVPPSVNHYVRHTKGGRHYITAEGKAFKEAVWIFAAQRQVVKATAYCLEATVYLGRNQRLDGDNAWKCIGDGLRDARVIQSDATIKRWVMNLDRDWKNPRTELCIRALPKDWRRDQ